MSKVTSKLQVTIPKAVAKQYRIAPGDEVLWVAAGDSVRLVPAREQPKERGAAARLRLFDQATRRQEQREQGAPRPPAQTRGWTRDELYDRGRSG